jgi:hypothetical protein
MSSFVLIAVVGSGHGGRWPWLWPFPWPLTLVWFWFLVKTHLVLSRSPSNFSQVLIITTF